MTQFFDTKAELRGRISAFLPERIFDAHAHIHHEDFMRTYAGKPEHVFGTPHVTAREYLQGMAEGIPGAPVAGALLIPAPDPMMSDRANGLRDLSTAFVARELDARSDLFGEVYVVPGDSEADIEAMLVHERIRGLKCYYFSSPHGNQGPANEFLPESAWRVADRRGMLITLHLACDGAMSDPRNLEYVETMARRYPRATLILAHAGRAFAAWTNLEPVKRLAKLENVCYDLSAICEAAPIQACIRAAGIDRVMWGSDYPCCNFVGRPVSFADRFVWFDEAAARACGHAGEVFQVLEESLIAMYLAADLLDLDRGAVRKLFYDNAARIIAGA